jgi:hypothetical protein
MDGELCDRGKVSDDIAQKCNDLDGAVDSFCFKELASDSYFFWKNS